MRNCVLLVLISFSSLAMGAELSLTLGGKTFTVELAETPEEHATGLMYRTQLAPDHGMLFIYSEPHLVTFWMKNTLLPLDILFFDGEARLIGTYPNVKPCRYDPCRRYPSQAPIQYALELPSGTLSNLGLHKGDQFKIGVQR